MAQQPNVEITAAEKPREVPEPGVAVDWRDDKPGLAVGPHGMAGGGGVFGSTGPDPGWGIKMVNRADLPDNDPSVRKVITGLVMARAASFGRAAIPEDLEVALALAGYDDDPPEWVVERRNRWLENSHHEQRHGVSAIAEVDKATLMMSLERVRYALRHSR